MDRQKSSAFLGLIFVAAASSVAPAAGKDKTVQNPFAQYSACAAIASDSERLTCYDGLAPVMENAETNMGDAALAETRKKSFGAEGFAKDEDLENIERLSRIESPVTDISLQADRRLIIRLENGQVWRQVSTDRVVRAPKKGVAHTALIRRVIFGEYQLRLEPEGRTIEVKRME